MHYFCSTMAQPFALYLHMFSNPAPNIPPLYKGEGVPPFPPHSACASFHPPSLPPEDYSLTVCYCMLLYDDAVQHYG